MRLYLLLVFLLAASSSYSQLRPLRSGQHVFSEEDERLEAKNKTCTYEFRYTDQQRRTFYPFSQARKILLVSFRKPDSLIMGGTVPVKSQHLLHHRLEELTELNSSQIDTLSDILYNNTYKAIFHTYDKQMCYTPLNAIVFLNDKGRAFAFIELGFPCGGHRLSSRQVKAGDFCDGKMELLKQFFIRHDIKFGTSLDDLDPSDG